MFNGVRTAWLEAGLIEHKAGYPGMLAFGNPGPKSGKLTRYRATPQLLTLCAEHGITPEDVTEHFQFEYEMPAELVQLTSPFRRTPTTPRTGKLRSEVAELNEFFAKHTLTHPTIKHLGWVRKFHLAHHPDFNWNKGGRLYSYPPGPQVNYQNVDKDTRLNMDIDGKSVIEIDISSSYLSIFYAWNDQQLDTEQDDAAAQPSDIVDLFRKVSQRSDPEPHNVVSTQEIWKRKIAFHSLRYPYIAIGIELAPGAIGS